MPAGSTPFNGLAAAFRAGEADHGAHRRAASSREGRAPLPRRRSASVRDHRTSERPSVHGLPTAEARREGGHHPHHVQHALRPASRARGRAADHVRTAGSHRRRRDRCRRPDRARPGRGRRLLSGDDAEAYGCRGHFVVERLAAGDGRGDAPESTRRRRAGGPDSRRHRQSGRGSARDPSDAPAGEPRVRHGDAACPHRAPWDRRTPNA